MTKTLSVLVFGFLTAAVLATSSADAKPQRVPARASVARVTTLDLNQYRTPAKVVRERKPGKQRVVFHAEPRLIESGALAVFEIRSIGGGGSVIRWRCIASHDVADCLGRPVAIRYLPDDEKVELTVSLVPRTVEIPQAIARGDADVDGYFR